MTDIAVFLGPLQGLLGYFQRDHQQNVEEQRYAETARKDALQAMYQALITTKKYQEAQPDGLDRDKQLELSGLWSTAAVKSRQYLEDAMPMNMDKASYWLSGIKWPEDKVKSAGIDLETVEARIKELMKQ